MPMSFPDLESLRNRAVLWKFRAPHEGESEADYRTALADHVQPSDVVESMEIRSSVGWDQFSDATNTEMLMRAMLNGAAMKETQRGGA